MSKEKSELDDLPELPDVAELHVRDEIPELPDDATLASAATPPLEVGPIEELEPLASGAGAAMTRMDAVSRAARIARSSEVTQKILDDTSQAAEPPGGEGFLF